MCPDPRGGSARVHARAGQRGMTLIELMIVVALLAILGSIAVPSYQSYVTKARRADARGALTNAAQMLERCSTENPTTGYATAACTAGFPFNSENGHYRLTLSPAPTVSAYTLLAAPVVGSAQASDTPCATFTLTQSGQRGVTGTLTAAQCW